jgi:hypothetical protein
MARRVWVERARRMTVWTIDQVKSMAPDTGVFTDAQSIANKGAVLNVHSDGRALWCEVKGSGKNPYRVQIDLQGPAFKCSCPSQKFPCKHAVALMVHVANGKPVGQDAPPTSVTDWINGRDSRSKAKATAAAPLDPAAAAKKAATAAKTAAKRDSGVTKGVADLNLWLRDLIRAGLSHAKTQPRDYWETMGARMVDAKAKGLGDRVRALGESVHSGSNWAERLLLQTSQLYLLIEAYQRLDTLPEGLQNDVRAQIGFSMDKDDVLQNGEAVDDVWKVYANDVEQQDKLRSMRIWAQGQNSGRYALLLGFAPKGQPFDIPTLPIGAAVRGTMRYYPSAYPMRALLGEHQTQTRVEFSTAHAHAILQDGMNAYAAAIAVQPWLPRFPLLLRNTTLMIDDTGRWRVRDSTNATLPLPRTYADWNIMAHSGVHPCTIFGEWDGEVFNLLQVW